MVASFFTDYFVHILTGPGYQWWSGMGSDLGELTIIGGLAMLYRKGECHMDGCHRIGWHPSEQHDGHVVCRRHHPHTQDPDHPLNRKD